MQKAGGRQPNEKQYTAGKFLNLLTIWWRWEAMSSMSNLLTGGLFRLVKMIKIRAESKDFCDKNRGWSDSITQFFKLVRIMMIRAYSEFYTIGEFYAATYFKSFI